MKVAETHITRIKQIERVIQEWISPRNSELRDVVNRTIEEGLFTREEIYYQLQTLKKAVSGNLISKWASSVLDRVNPDLLHQMDQRTVLAIHAGNIPLAGFQDLLVIALSGASYHGKFSTRDPWILPLLARHLASKGLLNVSQADTRLNGPLENITDLFFSGGTDSWEIVREECQRLGMDLKTVRTLLRTAQFSAAILDKADPTTMRELVRAIALYQGRGCRSVALVLSHIPLDDIKCGLGDYFDEFNLAYPERVDRKENLRVRAAYNRALNRPFAWIDNILLEEGEQIPAEAGIVQWRQVESDCYHEILEPIRDRLQTVYVPLPEIRVPGFESQTELLQAAQTPSIDWRPDGIDPLEWLFGLHNEEVGHVGTGALNPG